MIAKGLSFSRMEIIVSPAPAVADDGRVFVGLSVTGPVDGFYRYEYTLHNRDNVRGIGALRIPLCPGARVRAAGFRDIDTNAANDWSATASAGELVFASLGAHQPWNTLYNFWFESDAAPGDTTLVLDEGLPGPGAPSVLVSAQAPVAPLQHHRQATVGRRGRGGHHAVHDLLLQHEVLVCDPGRPGQQMKEDGR